MRPLAILSTDANPHYNFSLPMVAQSWAAQGWDCEIICVNVPEEVINLLTFYSPGTAIYSPYDNNEKFSAKNPALFTQCVRLYWPANMVSENRYCLLSDADMFIASSFLNRDFDKVNVFGHDLTGYGQIPMCYVGATAAKWKNLMGDQGLDIDLIDYADKDSPVWEKAWGSDQDILTGKLKAYGFDNINFIKRGNDNNNSGLPLGRLDRFNWKYPATEVHDAHLLRPGHTDDYFYLLQAMAIKLYPKEDWGWLPAYRRDYLKLLQL